ncbi:hypothetical protein BV25DRAFT_705715 [Artomyces pyxidatus]|uniref:Uncharacterized protein n=1 Tax=Artomyces pyxidatus TaxID=48021 RepID=A0ACB8SZY8_9AGAM|nr:hypothetical protein BV25DRAFT_705715 [Artomyces pyxidatus]
MEPPQVLEPTPYMGSDGIRALPELKALAEHGVSICLWGEDALLHYHVPTCVFRSFFLLVQDDDMEKSEACLTSAGNWIRTPLQPFLARTFQISVEDMLDGFSEFRMIARVVEPEDPCMDFRFVLIPASFFNFTLTSRSMVPDSPFPIPTFAAFVDSLLDTVASTGKVAFASPCDPKAAKIASAVFERVTLWYGYLLCYNRDYAPYIPSIVQERNLSVANYLAEPKHTVSPRHWRKLCELRGVIPVQTPKQRRTRRDSSVAQAKNTPSDTNHQLASVSGEADEAAVS